MRYLICLMCVFASCTNAIQPLKGVYTSGNFEQTSNKNKEQVWSNLIDFFAKNGLSIKIIDKSSGLIVSERSRLIWSLEKDNGQLYNPAAWVAVEKMKSGGKDITTAWQVLAEWNVRLKDSPTGGTIIGINLVNSQYLTSLVAGEYVSFKPGTLHSTGIFEQKIFDAIK
jgi:hypothetical protein